MPWGRAILALAAMLFVIGGMATLVAMGSGAWRPDFAATPGLNPEDLAALSAPYDDARQGRDGAIVARLAQPNERTQAEIDHIQSLLPPGEPDSSRLTAFRVSSGASGNRLWGVREYEYRGHVVRAETMLYRARATDPWLIEGFNVNAKTRAEASSRALNFATEPRGVQSVIAAAVIIPLVTLLTFLIALFRPGLKWRWLWLLPIAVGVGTIYADTSTDALSFLPLSAQLFGAGATWTGSVFDGWVFSASMPLGAAAFWLFAPRTAKPAS